VLADPGLLERIVANLLANAVKWSPARGRVRVVAGVVPDGVDLRIVDRGPGIALEDRARVFEPFQRTGDRASVLGTGLGLAVARGFAEATGGTIAVDDTPGGGTTMVVHLPVAQPPAAAVGERPPADIPTHGAR
jgi:two-component system sensor histidine kinase KdpD